MTVCFLSTNLPNLYSGGIENVTYRLSQAFVGHGIDVKFICLEDIKDKCPLVETLSLFNCNNDVESVKEFLLTTGADIVVNQSVELRWFFILDKVKKLLPDIRLVKVHHTDPLSMVKGILDNEPLHIEGGTFSRFLYRVNPINILRRNKRRNHLISQFRSWVCFYDRVVLLSSRFIPDFIGLSGSGTEHKIAAIANPVEFNKRGNAEKAKTVLYVGRLNREAKRPDRIVRIWERVYKSCPDWKLKIVGDGPLRVPMEEYCHRKKIGNIEFAGQTDPSPYYKEASILCITSTYEGFSLVCAEAISNSVIPVAFDSYGAIRDLVRNGETGVLIPPFRINQYIEALKSFMNNECLLADIRENIEKDRDFIDRFSVGKIVVDWLNLFKSLN